MQVNAVQGALQKTKIHQMTEKWNKSDFKISRKSNDREDKNDDNEIQQNANKSYDSNNEIHTDNSLT